MQLSFNAIILLRHVLSYTGEKEMMTLPNGKTQEVDSPRRLNGYESAQRRHFFKNTDEAMAERKQKRQKLIDEYNKINKEVATKLKEENPKKENEKDDEYEGRIGVLVFNIREKDGDFATYRKNLADIDLDIKEVHVEEKTSAVLKKCYKEFGDKTGFNPADDNTVEELSTILA